MKNKKVGDSVLYTYFLSLGISVFSLLVCAFVASIVIYSGKDPTQGVGVASLITLILSAALSGIIISRISCEGGVKIAGLSALATVFIMLIIGVILNSGKASPGAFINYGCYVGISLLSAYLGRKRGRKRRR